MSETPRTDALKQRLIVGFCLPKCDAHFHEEDCPWGNGKNVAIKAHLQLELELNEVREKNLWCVNELLKKEKQRDQWREVARQLYHNHHNPTEYLRSRAAFEALEKSQQQMSDTKL